MPGDTAPWLWAGVLALGAYHGLNPAMGWPLAVARGLSERRGASVLATFVPLAAGHLLAMTMVLVPFALLSWILAWNREIHIGAGAAVVAFGLWRLLQRRHPRWLMRIGPQRILLWSALMATAHGAALMLLPLMMGLCGPPAVAGEPSAAHAGMLTLMQSDLLAAVLVSLVHSGAMMVSGMGAAWIVYRYLGLRALRSAWFDLDTAWATSLLLSGGIAIVMALPPWVMTAR